MSSFPVTSYDKVTSNQPTVSSRLPASRRSKSIQMPSWGFCRKPLEEHYSHRLAGQCWAMFKVLVSRLGHSSRRVIAADFGSPRLADSCCTGSSFCWISSSQNNVWKHRKSRVYPTRRKPGQCQKCLHWLGWYAFEHQGRAGSRRSWTLFESKRPQIWHLFYLSPPVAWQVWEIQAKRPVIDTDTHDLTCYLSILCW